MSIEKLKSAFQSIRHGTDWSLQLLRITISRRDGTKYASRQIILQPDDYLAEFVHGLAERYLGTEKGSLSKYSSVVEYDGTINGLTIYKLDRGNDLISEQFENFANAIGNPDVEADSMSFESAYVIKGSIFVGDEDTPIKLVSMQNPITTLKHKFSLIRDNGKFKKLDSQVLSLRSTWDVVVIGSTVYFLTMNGENLFHMERAYKSVCQSIINSIETADMVVGFDVFKSTATTGHNPRRFVAFNNERFEALKNTKTRKAMAKRFGIPLDADGKLDATVDGAAERIVKVLCNKGMVDPFKNAPVEVSSAKPW